MARGVTQEDVENERLRQQVEAAAKESAMKQRAVHRLAVKEVLHDIKPWGPSKDYSYRYNAGRSRPLYDMLVQEARERGLKVELHNRGLDSEFARISAKRQRPGDMAVVRSGTKVTPEVFDNVGNSCVPSRDEVLLVGPESERSRVEQAARNRATKTNREGHGPRFHFRKDAELGAAWAVSWERTLPPAEVRASIDEVLSKERQEVFEMFEGATSMMRR